VLWEYARESDVPRPAIESWLATEIEGKTVLEHVRGGVLRKTMHPVAGDLEAMTKRDWELENHVEEAAGSLFKRVYRLCELVALEAGNSPQMVFRHYRELVKPAAARAWFAIRPEPAGAAGLAAGRPAAGKGQERRFPPLSRRFRQGAAGRNSGLARG